ncbi:ABCA1 [Cordylochernes scorpioides]|uniref:ABCA1 n=1 Tax=Cordylochernes scorpioides TaxID=51811 RepID=A0ABY6KET5_9ARAC|nr:ABCA1 [Cordylochernes scorpioides]
MFLCCRYGEGYTLMLRVGNMGSPPEVATFMAAAFGQSAILTEQHLNQMEYQLAPTLPLSIIFRRLQAAKETLDIEDYSVSQTTLDQVTSSFILLYQTNLTTSLSLLISRSRHLPWYLYF